MPKPTIACVAGAGRQLAYVGANLLRLARK